jgi:hypothetical protein
VLHRLLLDLVRLGDERLDDKEDDQCEDERLDDLERHPNMVVGSQEAQYMCWPAGAAGGRPGLHNQLAGEV